MKKPCPLQIANVSVEQPKDQLGRSTN